MLRITLYTTGSSVRATAANLRLISLLIVYAEDERKKEDETREKPLKYAVEMPLTPPQSPPIEETILGFRMQEDTTDQGLMMVHCAMLQCSTEEVLIPGEVFVDNMELKGCERASDMVDVEPMEEGFGLMAVEPIAQGDLVDLHADLIDLEW